MPRVAQNWHFATRVWLVLLSSLFAAAQQPADPDYFALCLIVKNQQADVREWVQHHRDLGAGRIYIYDHNSTVPLVSQLYDYIDDGLVEYKYFKQYEHPSGYAQSWVYDQCLERYTARHEWMAFIDTDEFLMLRGSYKQMPDLLREYEEHAALAVNWVIFGSSGHLRKPQGSTLASYTRCFEKDDGVNRHVKIIAHMKYTKSAGGTPHEFVYVDGKQAVDESYNVVDSPFTVAPRSEKVVLHHYVLKSLEEFLSKVQRGAAHGTLTKELNFFWMMDTQATALCLDAVDPAQTS